jgi:ribose 5-phosphate isomerase B
MYTRQNRSRKYFSFFLFYNMSAVSSKKKIVYIGSDHAGFDLKEILRKYIADEGHEVFDVGCFSTESVDYPDVAKEVCEKVVKDAGSFGVLICGTGTGMALASNKKAGIRAAVCTNHVMAEMARLHNDANILCLGSRIIDTDLAQDMVDTFLETEFSGDERHERRIKKIAE